MFHVLEAKAARSQSQVFILSPKASCVQVHSLATIVQVDGTFVTDRFESLRYESYFSLNISEAQFVSFHLQCLCCHQKSAVCKYTSLATTVKSSGVLVTLLRSTVCYWRDCWKLVIHSHPACCVCVMALMYLFISLAYKYAAEGSIACLLSSGVCHVL